MNPFLLPGKGKLKAGSAVTEPRGLLRLSLPYSYSCSGHSKSDKDRGQIQLKVILVSVCAQEE
jgi:hypothetical protein